MTMSEIGKFVITILYQAGMSTLLYVLLIIGTATGIVIFAESAEKWYSIKNIGSIILACVCMLLMMYGIPIMLVLNVL